MSTDHFADRLIARIEQTRSLLVVGLDPELGQLPPELLDGVDDLAGAAAAAARFCRAVIDGVADVAPAVKPQSAFFEAFGAAGLHALEEVTAHARAAGLLVIEDAKRGDIGSTMAAYAAAALGRMRIGERELPVHDSDAVTLSPYLGPESLAPMLGVADAHGKGVFVLVRTSNPGSARVQGLQTPDGAVFEHVARMVAELGEPRRGEHGYANVGAVAGLTYPDDARVLRALMPHAFLLVPGLGPQGGAPEDFPLFVNADGLGAVPAASRAVAGGWRSHGDAGGAFPTVDGRVRAGANAAARELTASLRGPLARADRWRW
ncbi:orotidine-5'-phosphate decarboxylase [Conexibacter stalactiti]|uniref:Orotidine 5'-phosphate decarboxylase n=1 Tax=Conexibacter stalactiti TaxID=1940611 RepID=A0ABU4HU01_9ACTN|nr:orotidine-5'-phosphate decarboxylase [Conexibacter stalactiti]MDW5596800.1 orotidine-5'-phosphate decarboxylase [Conexibacter stalactiti]MEC5037442.1 orotidine-5'-phosphate decarboxylase [Conexibacter stalactiti]